jgi:hypothetical protein
LNQADLFVAGLLCFIETIKETLHLHHFDPNRLSVKWFSPNEVLVYAFTFTPFVSKFGSRTSFPTVIRSDSAISTTD